MARTRFSRHFLTQAALEALALLEPGDTLTWEEMSAILGRDARLEARRYVWSARQILLRRGVVIHADGRLWPTGLHRLTDAERAEHVPDLRRRRVRKQARRELRELRGIDLKKLTAEQQAAVLQARANAGTLIHFTGFRFTEAQRRQIMLNPPPPSPPDIDQ